MTSVSFADALRKHDLEALRGFRKIDAHNHVVFGFGRDLLLSLTGIRVPAPPVFADLDEMDTWREREVSPLLSGTDWFGKKIELAVRQAYVDGVSHLCLNIGRCARRNYPDPREFDEVLVRALEGVGGEVRLSVDLALSREEDADEAARLVAWGLHSRYVSGVDLMGDERRGVGNCARAFKAAAYGGLRLKGHAGETSGATEVLEIVKKLHLDEVNHGLSLTTSPEAMAAIAEWGVVVNVCPTSNVRLSRVSDYRTHPIRKLFDYGVNVALGTDDILLFGTNINEEYLRLCSSGCMRPEELDLIRLSALERVETVTSNGLNHA